MNDSLAVAQIVHELHNINNTLWWACFWIAAIALNIPSTNGIADAIRRLKP